MQAETDTENIPLQNMPRTCAETGGGQNANVVGSRTLKEAVEQVHNDDGLTTVMLRHNV